MDENLLESLLNEGENSALDYKKEQYHYYKLKITSEDIEKLKMKELLTNKTRLDLIKSNNLLDEELTKKELREKLKKLNFKSEEIQEIINQFEPGVELLKDILAFSNSFRRTEAYILIGVKEKDNGIRGEISGISEHLNDAHLQQFVNSKTNRPLDFSYKGFTYNKSEIGIISVPIQKRPFYLKKDFGKLKANEVYIRRGSSTGLASPDEIAEMGRSDSSPLRAEPVLDLSLTNPKTKETYKELKFSPVRYEPLLTPEYLKEKSTLPPGPYNLYGTSNSLLRKKYHKELIDYIFKLALSVKIGFVIENKSDIPAKSVSFNIKVEYQDNFFVFDEYNVPEYPRLYDKVSNLIFSGFPKKFSGNNVKVSFHEDWWDIEVTFGDIPPGKKKFSDGVIIMGSEIIQLMCFDCNIYANNISKPLRVPLKVMFLPKVKPMTWEVMERFVMET